MRFAPTLHTAAPETVSAQPGQWIDYQGARGRYAGRSPAGVVFIAWSRAARGPRFRQFRECARKAGA